MALIYISSTYEDLKKEREASAQAVRCLGHRVIAMEDYVASDKRRVDRCLKDVRYCVRCIYRYFRLALWFYSSRI